MTHGIQCDCEDCWIEWLAAKGWDASPQAAEYSRQGATRIKPKAQARSEGCAKGGTA